MAIPYKYLVLKPPLGGAAFAGVALFVLTLFAFVLDSAGLLSLTVRLLAEVDPVLRFARAIRAAAGSDSAVISFSFLPTLEKNFGNLRGRGSSTVVIEATSSTCCAVSLNSSVILSFEEGLTSTGRFLPALLLRLY